ncbi:MAG: twin-arginine translocation protein, TatA/E family subunit [Candidatus Woesebacteria bacterium GW2011_GWB1_45_5]|uniref:Twin-arginine translocation protein, TatA/E family subunit n=1 Tax=Candidatus Woesebacteria bacterium GW2011_GWB1_45_5 TaxID=1618581 RepID=A0A0G1PXQ3_9BACT|nr:MAG: twin-arginine translocation protein, TatA/E family subunit [Candidatus Woesebacteria bacterium GW2011_GWB1_45_5]
MLNNLGTVEVMVVSVVLLLLFGGKKLNDIAHGLGKSQKEFEKAKKEYEEVLTQKGKEEAPPEETPTNNTPQAGSDEKTGGDLNA